LGWFDSLWLAVSFVFAYASSGGFHKAHKCRRQRNYDLRMLQKMGIEYPPREARLTESRSGAKKQNLQSRHGEYLLRRWRPEGSPTPARDPRLTEKKSRLFKSTHGAGSWSLLYRN